MAHHNPIGQSSLSDINETITLNEIFRKRKLFCEDECNEIRKRSEEIDRKLNGLMNVLRGRKFLIELRKKEKMPDGSVEFNNMGQLELLELLKKKGVY